MPDNAKPMLIHVSPKIIQLSAYVDVELIDVSIPELDLVLRNNEEITTRKPYPNKCYHVACRKVGRKAINGLLIESDKHLDSFSVITRWKIQGERIATHTAEFNVVDKEHSLVSDNMILWANLDFVPLSTKDNFKCRTPDSMMKYSPLEAQPTMSVTPEEIRTCAVNATDTVAGGFIIERKQVIDVPTIEVERMDLGIIQGLRLPDRKDAFKVGENNE